MHGVLSKQWICIDQLCSILFSQVALTRLGFHMKLASRSISYLNYCIIFLYTAVASLSCPILWRTTNVFKKCVVSIGLKWYGKLPGQMRKLEKNTFEEGTAIVSFTMYILLYRWIYVLPLTMNMYILTMYLWTSVFFSIFPTFIFILYHTILIRHILNAAYRMSMVLFSPVTLFCNPKILSLSESPPQRSNPYLKR